MDVQIVIKNVFVAIAKKMALVLIKVNTFGKIIGIMDFIVTAVEQFGKIKFEVQHPVNVLKIIQSGCNIQVFLEVCY